MKLPTITVDVIAHLTSSSRRRLFVAGLLQGVGFGVGLFIVFGAGALLGLT